MSVINLGSKENKTELQRLNSIFKSSYGPLGIGVMFQPSTRGYVTVTSHSQRLIPLLHSSTPVGRLLLDALHNHTRTHRDSGLYAGLLATDLILRGLELPLPQLQVAVVTSRALSLVTDCLCDESAGVDVGKCRLELSSREEMMSLLRCLLCSKTAITQLTDTEVDHLSSLLLQTFLIAIPKKANVPVAIAERVNILVNSGRPVTQSHLLTGLLLECSPNDGEREQLLLQGLGRGSDEDNIILTALFDVSMAGDIPDDFPRDVELVVNGPRTVEEGRREVEAVVLKQLLSVASHLVEMGVKFIGCQKVMHPLLKDYVRDKGVIAVDRLSLSNLRPLRDLTGGQIISSLTTGLSPASLGKLTSVHHTSILGKKYMALKGSGGYCSLVLCCPTDFVADELYVLCSSALYVLQQCLQYPYVLHGGGCLETQLSHFLLTKGMRECSEDLLEEIQCNEKTFKAVMKSVAMSFRSVAASLEHHGGTVLSDSSHHHCWFFPPEGCLHQPGGEELTQSDECYGAIGRVEESTESDLGGCASVNERSSYQAKAERRANISSDKGRTVRSNVCEEDGEDGEKWRSGMSCGCGCLRLLDLPPTCEWIPLGNDRLSTYVPDPIQQCLKKGPLKRKNATPEEMSNTLVETLPFPSVCDVFSPKLRAIETAGDLSSTILRIAFSISEK